MVYRNQQFDEDMKRSAERILSNAVRLRKQVEENLQKRTDDLFWNILCAYEAGWTYSDLVAMTQLSRARICQIIREQRDLRSAAQTHA